MTAAHKRQQEIAQYVFDTQGCNSCHAVGQGGKLGFTSRGAAAKVPDTRKSEQQQHRVARFQEFGCTFCHQMKSDGIGMSAVGAKLSGLHLGCVDIEKQLSSGRR